MNSPLLKAISSVRNTTKLLLLCLILFLGLPARAEDVDQSISLIEIAIKDAVRAYKGKYPNGNNDPNPVRRRFLGIEPNDQPGSSHDYSADLRTALDQALALRQQNLNQTQLDRLSKVIDLGLEVALQGWLICGNISLLEGLRISYPTGGSQSRPTVSTLPYGCIEGEFPFVTVKDSCRAQHFYAEGVRALANVLSKHAGDSQGKVIVDVDIDPIPAPINNYLGHFDNDKFPLYTYYVDSNLGTNYVVPIQTEAALMGQLLKKQAQATQTIGYRLWTAAYFNSATQRDPSKRQQLLDAAVHEFHAGANLQFLSSVALAANVGDQAYGTPETPFDLTQLRNARVNVSEARSTIDRIRHNEKPTLPIDEVMAGDQQVNELISVIKGSGGGSITRAQNSYDAAKNTLFRVQQNQVQAFADEQTRQNGFYNSLASLTGKAPDPSSIQTAAGQASYRQQVAEILNNLLIEPIPDYSLGASELVQDIKQVRFQRQEVINKQDILDSYPARIKIIEDTLGANISAIKSAEGSITAAQTSIGLNNAFRATISASGGFDSSLMGSKWFFRSSLNLTIDPQAIVIASLQNDITRASNLKEIEFLQNNAAEQCRNLLLDQNQALGALKSQIILLQNAEDDVRRVLGSADRILAQLNRFDQLSAELYYNDPIFNQELTAEEEQANSDLNAVIGNLYKLGRLLEQRWIEPFNNPVSVLNQQPKALGNGDPNFARFWSLESIFSLGTVNVRDVANAAPPPQQAAYFYSAMRAWDAELRADIRAFDGDLAPVEVSLRQDVFGYPDVKTVGGNIIPIDLNPFTNPNYLADLEVHDNNVRRFKNLLLNHGLYFYGPRNQQVGDKYRGFLLPFHLSYYDVGFTGGRLGLGNLFGQINAWNFRVDKFKVKVIPASNKSVFTGQPSTPIIFAQAGLVSNLDFFERNAGRVNIQRRVREINLDNYVRYNLNDLNQTQNSPYLLFSIAKQSNYPTDAEIPTATASCPTPSFDCMPHRFWSPFCSRWLLEFVPVNDFEIENIDDIVIQMSLRSGAPSTPAWIN